MDPAAIAAILLMSVRRRFDKFIGLLHEALFACAPLAIQQSRTHIAETGGTAHCEKWIVHSYIMRVIANSIIICDSTA